jgi:hypothetical protein
MATTPYPFVAGAVLTASQLNSTFNVPVNTQSASYVLLATDAGKRVRMTAAGATTITVNTSLFAAGDNLRIENGPTGGVCTVTAGTATVVSAGPLAIPVNGGGQLFFTSSSAATWFPDAVTASPSGLTFIAASGAQSAQANIALNNCFSATYSNYKIIIDNLSQSVAANSQFRLRVGGVDTAGTGYFTERYEVDASAIQGFSISAASYWSPSYITSTADGSSMSIDIYRPFAVASTAANFQSTRTDSTTNIYAIGGSMFQNAATSFDGFNIVPASGTVTCTNIRVYGYSNS